MTNSSSIPIASAASQQTPIVVIVGPTASGKTALSISLAQAINGEIINTDSVLTYRGMNIGSAKPTVSERAGVPHHVVDVWDVTHDATVAEFQDLARAAIDDVRARGKTPVLVGGSALYVRAIVDELEFPGTDRDIRSAWQTKLADIGPEALHAILAEQDPLAATQILSSNERRVVRALEVIEMTGKPFKATLPPYESIYPCLVMLGIRIDRDTLDSRIEERVHSMWAAGFVDEVRNLDGLAASPTASRAIGYQQVLDFLAGECDESEAQERTIVGTRKLARRQERMLRKDPRTVWLEWDSPELLAQAVATVTASVDHVG